MKLFMEMFPRLYKSFSQVRRARISTGYPDFLWSPTQNDSPCGKIVNSSSHRTFSNKAPVIIVDRKCGNIVKMLAGEKWKTNNTELKGKKSYKTTQLYLLYRHCCLLFIIELLKIKNIKGKKWKRKRYVSDGASNRHFFTPQRLSNPHKNA